MYMWHQSQWLHITKDSLMNLFIRGAVLVDVLFSTQQYVPGQLSGFLGMYDLWG